MPAAACGCVGIKPTWGRVSLRGTFPMEPTFDHVGPIARSARDCAIAMNAMAGFDPGDPWSPRQVAEEEFTRLLGRKIKGRRIGYDPGFRPVPVEEGVWENFEKALRCFEELGCEVVEVKLPSADEFLQDRLRPHRGRHRLLAPRGAPRQRGQVRRGRSRPRPVRRDRGRHDRARRATSTREARSRPGATSWDPRSTPWCSRRSRTKRRRSGRSRSRRTARSSTSRSRWPDLRW